ncbi:YSIRK-type signal peptide-containing protein [Limosilactobacillus gastricus]|uniref:YSIRK-type signal peptide-containing protein n=1 Tax=Limosilactobacillus gastricus TaxID=227942 RepID=UPI00129969DB|nr:YSIRK-type signal peptide-containing protein [Limosilactobacillus gastricus]QGF40420.1 YSIRK-type signal peptide-containing protein [Limosilactobacillus gastricus]
MLGKNNINGKPMNVLRAQQRFGLRKLNIGVASVLLGTTFLFVNGTNALADSSSSLTTADTTTTSLNSSAASNTSSSAQVTDNASASSTSTATSTPTSSSTDSTSNDTASAVVTTMSAAVDTTDDGEITADSQEVFDNSISLSKTTTGNDGSTSPITISLNLTGNAGDTFTLQIPKNATYGQPSYGSLTGTVGTTTLTSDNNYWYVKYLLTANASFQDKVVLSETNNYAAQAKPISNIGTNELVMTLSGVNSDGESVGSTSKTYTSIITPGMNPQFTRDNPSTSTASSIAVNTNYRYLLKINEANGVQDSNSYASNQINSADNYGTIITIPVPSSFQLDESATATANAFTDQTTISQPNGIGTDIIITVPKGSGKQGYEGAAGYYLIGSYQTTTPSTDTVVSANAPLRLSKN